MTTRRLATGKAMREGVSILAISCRPDSASGSGTRATASRFRRVGAHKLCRPHLRGAEGAARGLERDVRQAQGAGPGRRLGGRLLLPQPVHLANDEEEDEGHDQEVD